MAVFPENMDKLNVQDPAASLSVIENYIRYMSERIEFSMRNMTKTVSAAGVSSAELYILVQAQAQILAIVQSAIGIIQGNITALQHSVQEAQTQIGAIQERLGEFESTDPTVKATLVDFEARIHALEHPTT